MNSLKNQLIDVCSKGAGGRVSLPHVAESRAASEQYEMDSISSISPTKFFRGSPHRKKVVKTKVATSDDETGEDESRKATFLPKTSWSYTDKMDNTTQPISFIHGYRNPAKGVDYGRFQGKSSVADIQISTEAGCPHNKSAVLHKLKGLFKNKGSLKDICTYHGVDDITNVQLTTTQHSMNETRRMKGGKVQRGTFLTRHSKWVNKFQSLQEEEPSHDVSGEGVMRPVDAHSQQCSHSTHPPSKHSPEPEDLVISQAGNGRCSSRGVYQITLGDTSILVIDHERNRASREARIRPLITGAFLTQEETSDDIGPNARMWVPPNTPYHDNMHRSIAPRNSIDESFELTDDMQRSMKDIILEDDTKSPMYLS